MTYIPKLAGVGKALPEKVVTSEENGSNDGL